RMDISGQPRNIVIPKFSPAIWLYPKDTDKVLHAELTLTFHGGGFMTSSTPNYNGKWRVDVDPSAPFYRYSSTYTNDTWSPFLDYDGFRSGDFQREAGWVIKQSELLQWQRTHLKEIGYTDAEVDDANYSYGRMLLERKYEEPFFAIYPQNRAIVDSSVSLEVVPEPDSIYRLWLYFVPVSDKIPGLKAP